MRIGLGVVFVGALAAGPVFAHAILREASIGDQHPVAADTATAVTLRFNSGIETRFAKVTLVTTDGQERVLTVTPGATAGLVTVDLPPLDAGSYGLRYKVLAADGHVTESLLRFKVTPAE